MIWLKRRTTVDVNTLQDLARHQVWADAQHWKTLHGNPALLEDAEIRKRLNHMAMAFEMLTTLACLGTPDMSRMKEREPVEELEAAMTKAHEGMAAALQSVDLEKMIQLPRGPKGPFAAPAGVLLLQALTHSVHHRGQNASRMRALGITPPMTDFVAWYALGCPAGRSARAYNHGNGELKFACRGRPARCFFG
jgi:uncharacterized damage-inducible protein DinB